VWNVALLLSSQVSWAKGSKKAVLGGDDIRLPSLQAPDAVGQAVPFWVRFVGDPKEWPGRCQCIQHAAPAADCSCECTPCLLELFRERGLQCTGTSQAVAATTR
jgi:hypothetical protein